MKCPMCGDGRSNRFARWSNFKIETCLTCGFRYIDTSAPEYPADAQYHYDEAEIGPIDPKRPHIQRRVRDVLRFRHLPAHALDIGCGKGETALALEKAGFSVTGIDMKSRVMAHLQARYPEVSWRCAATSELAGLSERFDVLTMYHVLEHIADPRMALARVKALANPGALIVIEVPNVSGWKARLQGQRWGYYKIDHVNYFRPTDLHRLAADLDLTVLATRGYQHFSYPQDVQWKDTIKGMLGLIGFQDVVSVFLRAR
jgi:2-polyprenyl-3-methyl-5-hydroxy-6-metoxy-1,4-benzoquinol methylase